MIFVSRFESRARQARVASFGKARRNISKACWAPKSASITPFRPVRTGGIGVLGCGARCRGFERASGTDAVGCKIGALTDAHAGVADQEEDIRAQIVAFEELPLQQLILFRAQWTGQSVWKARDVLASDQMSKFGKLVHPRQLMERPA